MEYNAHMQHSSNTSAEDSKPIFLQHDPHPQQRSQHHPANFHHRLHHDLPPTSSMDVKLLDTPTPNNVRGGGGSSSSRVHPSYEFESNQSLDQSQFAGRSSCQNSPGSGSSPTPVSAAAEYLRHQELSRGTPRKRVYQDWNQVAVFTTPGEAEEGIKNFENCRWKVGNKFTSREGFKVYWSCREGASCPVQIHLLYHSQLPRVVLFRNQPPHHHAEKVKTRGLLPEVESLIRDLFHNGVNKPRRIQFILQKKGMEEVPQTKLSNFLVKLRREAALQGTPVITKRGRDSYNDDMDDDDGGDGSYSNSHDDKSNNTLSPSAMFPSVILSTPSDHSHPNSNQMMIGTGSGGGYPNPNHSHPMNQGYATNTTTGGGGNGLHHFGAGGAPRYPSPGYQQHVNGSENGDNLYSPHHRQSSSVYSGRSSGSTAAAAAAGKDEDADQSEVVTCSSSRSRSLVRSKTIYYIILLTKFGVDGEF